MSKGIKLNIPLCVNLSSVFYVMHIRFERRFITSRHILKTNEEVII